MHKINNKLQYSVSSKNFFLVFEHKVTIDPLVVAYSHFDGLYLGRDCNCPQEPFPLYNCCPT